MKVLATLMVFGALFLLFRVGTRSAVARASNPATAGSLTGNPLRGSEVLNRACADCHTNRTDWPWYSYVPPASWMIRRDVERGRSKLDFSYWQSGRAMPTKNQLAEICDAVSDHSMPPLQYRMMHSNARLTAQEVESVCNMDVENQH
ncbi:MAG TPA: heme-binding domain-containing protein [Candidatus Bathyarchaeia archaeon]|nr:heme-binding domain-containing protein [Candidatus Bathyarchaeia archaeon]